MSTDISRILVPVDGSDNADRAVAHVIAAAKAGHKAEVHLINVQPKVRSDVTMFISREEIDDYRRDEAEKAAAKAVRMLKDAGVPHKMHIGLGDPGEIIPGFAKQLGCGQIVMGTRGMGSAVGRLLGSVAADVVKNADLPVTLIK